jgi:DNA-binding transcriptional LysR family regulator
MIDYRKMQQFIAVAEELSFQRASERLHMTQPPLSMAIQALEEYVGVPLLDRNRYRVRLTVAGAAFLHEARRAVAQAESAVHSARQAAIGQTGVLRLSFVPSIAMGILPAILRKFREEFPTVELTLTSGSSIHQIEELRRQHVDLALVVPPLHDLTDVRTLWLCDQSMALAVPSVHPIAKRKNVKLASLANEKFITFSTIEGPGFVAALLDACQKAGFFPHIAQATGQLHSILTMVSCGMGIAMVPSSMRRVDMDGVTYVNLSTPDISAGYTLSFAMRKLDDNPVVQAFIDIAIEHVAT